MYPNGNAVLMQLLQSAERANYHMERTIYIDGRTNQKRNPSQIPCQIALYLLLIRAKRATNMGHFVRTSNITCPFARISTTNTQKPPGAFLLKSIMDPQICMYVYLFTKQSSIDKARFTTPLSTINCLYSNHFQKPLCQF